MFFWKEKQNFCIIPAYITCFKPTIEELEQNVKYIQSQQLNNNIDIVLETYLLT